MSDSNVPASPLSAWVRTRNNLRAEWAARNARERRLILGGTVVLGAMALWWVALAPALATVRAAPAQLEALEAQAQEMQALAAEAAALRAVAPVPLDQAQAALSAAAQRLGAQAKLSLQGERALLTLKGISGEQLTALLMEARAGARAKVVEGSLNQSGPGVYDGSLTLALGGPR